MNSMLAFHLLQALLVVTGLMLLILLTAVVPLPLYQHVLHSLVMHQLMDSSEMTAPLLQIAVALTLTRLTSIKLRLNVTLQPLLVIMKLMTMPLFIVPSTIITSRFQHKLHLQAPLVLHLTCLLLIHLLVIKPVNI
jgi:hypothetical protein